MKKTILFDLDGTLTDSQEGILKSIKFALEYFGYDVPDEETLQLFLGPPLVDAFQEHCGMTFEQAEETYFKFRERYGTIGKFENTVYPNIVDLLAKCKTEQYTIALATAKPEHYAKDILDHFELTPYFDVIVGANYESGLLHKKEILEKALELCGNPLTDENGNWGGFDIHDVGFNTRELQEMGGVSNSKNYAILFDATFDFDGIMYEPVMPLQTEENNIDKNPAKPNQS